jgi:hypothetical protein
MTIKSQPLDFAVSIIAVAEVKARKNGGGFVQLETWLADFDLLFLRRNHADPLVVLPWRVWRSLLQRS